MDFAPLVFASAASSSSSTSEGKPKCLVEEDLLSLLGEDGSGVDCTLKLALPGGAAPLRPLATGGDARSVLQRHQGVLRPAGRCTMCGRTETPLWRHGPQGPKSLCNACGIRYKKEERQSRLTLGFPATITSKART
ncbi:hypothetical protein Taro_026598 [Colocasia esculenta]|uniref:GATA-type domain-containing protein n=1 Tax=Colocasia esculenta TaxID=4460 RepID=A0A843VFN2_COLES|nr:hypothetical protein [Colocasia esculenta]